LTGARVIVAPGRIIENGVVVVRGGAIEAAGPQGQTAIPADARIFDLKGKVVHAAFIDPYAPADRLAGKRPRDPSDDEESAEQAPGAGRTAAAASTTPAAAPNPAHPEDRVIDTLRR
jgi:imidazolonepropionase-like amidohydrolase